MNAPLLHYLPVEAIRHRKDARHRSDEDLAALAESMSKVGIINPIRVRDVGDGLYEVVAGSHRLQAAELNGWIEIAAIITDDDDLHVELAMIDENLMRAELSRAERAQQTVRRKTIYLELYPETAHGGDRPSRQLGDFETVNENNTVERFTTNTARATGLSERAVQRDAERGEKVSKEALDLVKDTRLDTGTYLDKLKRLPPEQQIEQPRRDIAAPARSGISARYVSIPPPKPTPDSSFVAFTSAADAIEGLEISSLIEGAGRQRSVLGQRASGVADRMAEILEGLG